MSRVGNMIERALSGLGQLRRDTRGMVLVYVSIGLAVLMGGAALVIDGGRVFTLQTELQSAADAYALAAAAELDGLSDAITRADHALDTLVANDQTFASGTEGVGIASHRYLASLPNDGAAIAVANETTDPAAARYVEVVVETRSIDNFFAQLISGGATTSTSARAVAGFTQAVCEFTPLYICNPFPGANSLAALEAEITDPENQRKLYKLKFVGNDAATEAGPGNFGLLEAPDGNGANALRETLARSSPNTCYSSDGVEMKTGQVASIRQALNVRFDIYDGPMNSDKSNANYRPARNVTKGYTGNNCNGTLDPAAKALPLDTCFGADGEGICPNAGGRMGDGGYDLKGYWSVNHPMTPLPNGWSNSNLPSRYQVYRWEIDSGNIPSDSGLNAGPEEGAPQCSSITPTDTPDRRLLYVAIMNCDGSIHGGSGGPYKPIAFAKIFITRPLETGAGGIEKGVIWAELVDIVRPGEDDNVIRDIVQLYR